MKIYILAVCKKTSGSLSNMEEEYIKRISPYLKVEVQEVGPVKKSSSLSRKKIIELEAEKIISKLPEDSYRISLDENGKHYNTKIFAKYINKVLIHTRKPVYFIIGGAYGMAKKVKERSHRVISLSHLTFTHEMSRVILLEQLYRAITIIKGKKYHY